MIREVNYALFSIDHRDSLRITSINKGFTQLLGYTKTDIFSKNMTLRDIIPDENLEEYMICLNRFSRSGNGSGYLEHPVLHKNGTHIIVLCYGKLRDDGSDISDILITDVSNHIKTHDLLLQQEKEKRLLLQKLSYMSENQEEYIADYNCKADYFEVTSIKDGQTHILYSADHYFTKLGSLTSIHPDDLEAYADAFYNCFKMKEKRTFDFRTTLFGKNYGWYRVTYGPYNDVESSERHIIGRIINIDNEKAKSQELQRQAQIDTLTSLYNQGASRSKIDEIALENPESITNAFIIIDLDDFKKVNDTYGHACGDYVLREIGETLRKFFVFGSDIIGRVGGDEFVIYIKDVHSKKEVDSTCHELLQQICRPFTYGNYEFSITASISVIMQDKGPDSFDHLYKCADETLLYHKTMHKNDVFFFK